MSRRIQLICFGALLALSTSISFAQETPVPLDIPINEIFNSTNTWMNALGPVVGLGIGISVALALLTFLGNQIIKAFRGGGR